MVWRAFRFDTLTVFLVGAALVPSSAIAKPMAAPVPENIVSWFSPNDMPIDVVAKGGAYLVRTRTTVRPDGSIKDCLIEISSGHKYLDALSCAIMVKRGKFAPAHSQDGAAVYGVYRTSITWEATDGPNPDSPVDVDLYLNELPAGVRSGDFGHVVLMFDENGRPTACQADAPSPTDIRVTSNPELLRLACDQLLQGWNSVPAKDDGGKPVPSVQNASVRFHTGQS
jgi:hypothetical protein